MGFTDRRADPIRPHQKERDASSVIAPILDRAAEELNGLETTYVSNIQSNRQVARASLSAEGNVASQAIEHANHRCEQTKCTLSSERVSITPGSVFYYHGAFIRSS